MKTPFASRFLVLLVAVTVTATTAVAPLTARAQFSIPILETKEYVLDPLAWVVSRTIIQSISRSTVNWINSGFEGSPAYETDLRRSLGRVADTVANDFFDALEDNTGVDLNSPFQEQVTDFLRTSYYRSTGSNGFFNREGYTLHRIAERDQAFLDGQFSEGGWDAWFEVVTKQGNNPIGALFQAQDELLARVESARVTRLNELSWGRGFLSWRGDCIAEAGESAEEQALADEEGCLEREVVTPGAVIEDQLTRTLGSNLEQLGLADEFNEVIAALMNQLIGEVLGGTGLSGVSRSSSGGGGSFINRATDPRTNAGTSTTSSLNNNFMSTIGAQIERVSTFRTEWMRIGEVAGQAAAVCTGAERDEAVAVAARAQTMTARAETALLELEAIRSLIDAIDLDGRNAIGSLQEASTRYEALVRSGNLPTEAELRESATESSSSSSSLYIRMQSLAQSCQ